jgi:putative ABC transport system substrate-binding protein
VFPDGTTMARSASFAAFSMQHRIPLISGWSEFPAGGNVMSYGPNLLASWRRLAHYVDRIAKGARPSSLPIEFPTVVEMVLNAKAAKAIGLRIPQSIFVRADRVIE